LSLVDRRGPVVRASAQANDLPGLLRENVADEIDLVEPLHDDDDGALRLSLSRL
jgi:hypothetical protein